MRLAMSAIFDELSFVEVPSKTRGQPSERGVAINGRWLGQWMALSNTVCILARSDPKHSITKQLLGRAASEFHSGHVPLYVCSLCGDFACGAVTVRVTELDDCFRWSEFSWETPSGTGTPITWLCTEERDFFFSKPHYHAFIY